MKDKRRLATMRAELAAMISGDDNVAQRFRGRYPTSSGQLRLPTNTKPAGEFK